jgi:uncharacterized protein (TIGR02246 family)
MRSVAFAFAILLVTSVAWAADDEQAIRDALAQFVANINAGNAAPVAALYTEDAIMLPPDGTRVEGRAKIHEVLQGFVDAKTAYSHIDLTDVGVDGDLAWNAGTYEAQFVTEKGEPATEKGTYIAVWRRDADGAWRMQADTWTVEAPGH